MSISMEKKPTPPTTETVRQYDARARTRKPSTFRLFLRKPLGVAAAIYMAILLLVTIFAQALAPYDPLDQDLRNTKQLPSAEHWLGTDSLGRDVLSRLIIGGQEAMFGVFVAVVTMLCVAVPLGLVAGYVRGRTDRLIMAGVDINMALPALIITLAVLAIFSNNMTVAMISVGILGSASLTRIIRSSVLAVREELFISAAVVIGLSDFQIIARHVFAHIRGIILVQTSLYAAVALGVQTGLAFLGFGPQPPYPTWGGMVAEASRLVQEFPWLVVPSGGIIFLTTLAFGLIGDALRDATADTYSATATSVKPRKAGSGQQHAATFDSAKPADPTALLSVRGLSVAFDKDATTTTVVQNVEFDIRPGETVGLVGESGSGKSVTALTILGLLPKNGRVTNGSMIFDGRDLTTLTQEEYRGIRGDKIAMISQEPMVALDPCFRVGSQIAEVVRTHDKCSRRQAKARAIELLEMVRLPEPEVVAKLYPHQVSGGMAQRVAIATALAGRPELLIADEPTTALDVTVQAGILDLLNVLQKETGMAILLVSHDWAVVATVCDRAVVMYAGEVVEQADIADLFLAPRHPYTRGLLDSSTHNATPGEPLPTIGGVVPQPANWPSGCHFQDRCPLATQACSERPIPLVALEDGRQSRCIRIDELIRREELTEASR